MYPSILLPSTTNSGLLAGGEITQTPVQYDPVSQFDLFSDAIMNKVGVVSKLQLQFESKVRSTEAIWNAMVMYVSAHKCLCELESVTVPNVMPTMGCGCVLGMGAVTCKTAFRDMSGNWRAWRLRCAPPGPSCWYVETFPACNQAKSTRSR